MDDVQHQQRHARIARDAAVLLLNLDDLRAGLVVEAGVDRIAVGERIAERFLEFGLGLQRFLQVDAGGIAVVRLITTS